MKNRRNNLVPRVTEVLPNLDDFYINDDLRFISKDTLPKIEREIQSVDQSLTDTSDEELKTI